MSMTHLDYALLSSEASPDVALIAEPFGFLGAAVENGEIVFLGANRRAIAIGALEKINALAASRDGGFAFVAESLPSGEFAELSPFARFRHGRIEILHPKKIRHEQA